MNLISAILGGLFVGMCGAAVKAFLVERFLLKGNHLLSVLVLIGRLLVDVATLFAMHHWLAALIAAAFGLCTDQIYFLLKLKRKRGD